MATLHVFNFKSQISFMRGLQINLAQVWPFYLVGPSQSPFPNTILCFLSIKCMYNHGKTSFFPLLLGNGSILYNLHDISFLTKHKAT
jgi:hypothetical protein